MEDTIAGLDVRPMTRHQLNEVMLIERDIYPFPWTKGNFSDSLLAGYDGSIVVAPDGERQDSLLGYAVVMTILDEAHLLNLSVAAKYQRAGYGRRLLRRLMSVAIAGGARGMFLEVRPSNEAGLALYASEGFVQVGIRRNYYPSHGSTREDAIVMRCELNQSEVAA